MLQPQETMHTVNEHLLYEDVIESDGTEHREETFLGAALTFVVMIAAAVVLTLLVVAL